MSTDRLLSTSELYPQCLREIQRTWAGDCPNAVYDTVANNDV